MRQSKMCEVNKTNWFVDRVLLDLHSLSFEAHNVFLRATIWKTNKFLTSQKNVSFGDEQSNS